MNATAHKSDLLLMEQAHRTAVKRACGALIKDILAQAYRISQAGRRDVVVTMEQSTLHVFLHKGEDSGKLKYAYTNKPEELVELLAFLELLDTGDVYDVDVDEDEDTEGGDDDDLV